MIKLSLNSGGTMRTVIDKVFARSPNARHKRILIIEDETMMTFLLDDMLTELGYNIAGIAQRFDEASDKIEYEGFDAAILDVNLNGQSTFALADMLQKKNMPFIFSTGYDQASLPEKYRTYPALQKPYSQAQLASHLELLLAS